MRISVICTNYNKESYLNECIDSVLAQDFSDFEFIIVDDASTDRSASIVESYVSKYPDKIRFIQNEINIGMAGGFNKAIPVAKGDIVCLIDSDDFWFPGKLKVVDEYFKVHENCVMHQHPLEIYDFAKPTGEYFRSYLYAGNIMQYIHDTGHIPLYVVTTGLSFKRDVLQKVLPIPLEFAKNGEAFLTRTVICYGEVGVTYKVFGAYRKTDTNVVFGNADWDHGHFAENILKPSLNKFYADNGFDLYFPPYMPPVKPKMIKRILHRVSAKLKG